MKFEENPLYFEQPANTAASSLCFHQNFICESLKLISREKIRLMPFRPLFPCVPWSRGTNNITLK